MAYESTPCVLDDRPPLSAGTESQLLKLRHAQLFVVHNEHSILIKSGDFAITFTKQTSSTLAAVVASVGDINWPLGRDSPVLKIGSRHFTFALPRLLYGLVLAERTTTKAMRCLEHLLTMYSTFEVHLEIGTEREHVFSVLPIHNEAASRWTAMAPEIMNIAEKTGCCLSTRSRSLMCPVGEGVSKTPASEIFRSTVLDPGPRLMKRVQQAHRLSAVSKLVCRTLSKGAIDVSKHVSFPHTLNVIKFSTVIASVDAFAKVVEVVELTGKHSAQRTPLLHSADRNILSSERFVESVCLDTEPTWTLNRRGLVLLLQVTILSARMHSSSDNLSFTEKDSRSSQFDIEQDLHLQPESYGEASRTPNNCSFLSSKPFLPISDFNNFGSTE